MSRAGGFIKDIPIVGGGHRGPACRRPGAAARRVERGDRFLILRHVRVHGGQRERAAAPRRDLGVSDRTKLLSQREERGFHLAVCLDRGARLHTVTPQRRCSHKGKHVPVQRQYLLLSSGSTAGRDSYVQTCAWDRPYTIRQEPAR